MDASDFTPGDDVIAGIKADLERYEAERNRTRRAVRGRVVLFQGLLLAAIVALALLFNRFAHPQEQWRSTPHLMLVVVGFIAAIGLQIAATSPAKRLQQSFRDRIIPLIFGFIDRVDYRHGETPGSFHRLPREAVGSFNNERFDDIIAGRYQGSSFELYEATLFQKSGKSLRDAFKGVVVSFDAITPFPGLLVATRKSGKASKATGFLRGLFGGELEELKSGVATLDEKYEFRTDNVEAARPLVTGRLAQALEWLNEAWPERPARVALQDRAGFLLVPSSKNFFELPGISQKLDYKAHVEPMIADMAALLATAELVRKVGKD